MGKCVVCGAEIQYNQFVMSGGKVYCPKCAPKKIKAAPTQTPEKAQADAEERYGKNTAADTSKDLVPVYIDSNREVQTDENPGLGQEVHNDEDAIANDPELDQEFKEEKKPRKKRGKKNDTEA